MSLLDDALRVSQRTRKTWLKALSASQRERLQAEITARQNQLGIAPPKATATAPPKLDEDRYNSIRSGSFIGGKRAIRVGRHVVLIPSQARYTRTRETLAYVLYRGVLTAYVARGTKLTSPKLPPETQAHILRTMFNVKT